MALRIAIWTGALIATATTSAQSLPQSDSDNDPRLARLIEFLAANHAPVKEFAAEFLAAADEHQLDWRLLPSISLVETGGGRTHRNYNIFGWNSSKGSFASVRDAIWHVASRLASSKLYRDKDLDHLLATYNRHASWAQQVKQLMLKADASAPLGARRFAVATD